ncbi:MAG: hypothetical protein ACRD19_10680 [Terriglobia bacterium]
MSSGAQRDAGMTLGIRAGEARQAPATAVRQGSKTSGIVAQCGAG